MYFCLHLKNFYVLFSSFEQNYAIKIKTINLTLHITFEFIIIFCYTNTNKLDNYKKQFYFLFKIQFFSFFVHKLDLLYTVYSINKRKFSFFFYFLDTKTVFKNYDILIQVISKEELNFFAVCLINMVFALVNLHNKFLIFCLFSICEEKKDVIWISTFCSNK